MRARVARIVGRGDEPTTGQIPFTPRAKRVLELSLREALAMGHNYIGTEHVLLGLAREDEGVAARILLDLDVDTDRLRQTVDAVLGVTPRPAGGPPRRRRRRRGPELWLAVGWALFAGALGIGILIGWAIWG